MLLAIYFSFSLDAECLKRHKTRGPCSPLNTQLQDWAGVSQKLNKQVDGREGIVNQAPLHHLVFSTKGTCPFNLGFPNEPASKQA